MEEGKTGKEKMEESKTGKEKMEDSKTSENKLEEVKVGEENLEKSKTGEEKMEESYTGEEKMEKSKMGGKKMEENWLLNHSPDPVCKVCHQIYDFFSQATLRQLLISLVISFIFLVAQIITEFSSQGELRITWTGLLMGVVVFLSCVALSRVSAAVIFPSQNATPSPAHRSARRRENERPSPDQNSAREASNGGISGSILVALSHDLISADWKFFFRELKVKEYVIKAAEKDNPMDVKEQIYQLLHRAKESHLLNKEKMIEALKSIDQNQLAEKYKNLIEVESESLR